MINRILSSQTLFCRSCQKPLLVIFESINIYYLDFDNISQNTYESFMNSIYSEFWILDSEF
jgi:hypothetical protein